MEPLKLSISILKLARKFVGAGFVLLFFFLFFFVFFLFFFFASFWFLFYGKWGFTFHMNQSRIISYKDNFTQCPELFSLNNMTGTLNCCLLIFKLNLTTVNVDY